MQNPHRLLWSCVTLSLLGWQSSGFADTTLEPGAIAPDLNVRVRDIDRAVRRLQRRTNRSDAPQRVCRQGCEHPEQETCIRVLASSSVNLIDAEFDPGSDGEVIDHSFTFALSDGRLRYASHEESGCTSCVCRKTFTRRRRSYFQEGQLFARHQTRAVFDQESGRKESQDEDLSAVRTPEATEVEAPRLAKALASAFETPGCFDLRFQLEE